MRQTKAATSSTTDLGVAATKRCIHEWGGDPNRIGYSSRQLTLLTRCCRVWRPRSWGERTASFQVAANCQHASARLFCVTQVDRSGSVVPGANPGKLAIVVMAEAHTPYVAPLLRDEYSGYRESSDCERSDDSIPNNSSNKGWIRPS
jgi:hypothetical protein